MVGWILHRDILELLDDRAHELFVGSWIWWSVKHLDLLWLKLMSSGSNKGMSILRLPEVDIESMKSEKVFPFISRIRIWQSPMMFWL